MSDKTLNTIIAFYLVAAVVTFGHAYNHIELIQSKHKSDGIVRQVTASSMSAVFWPLYWSVELFAPTTKAKDYSGEAMGNDFQ